ncbi:unnamed protein product [Agarophyton chilense]
MTAHTEASPMQFTLITSRSALVAILSATIQAHVTANDQLPEPPFEEMTVFHALEPPSITVSEYVSRVSKYAFCSEACLVAAYHYITRAVTRDPKLALSSLSVHRMFITAIVLASKYYDDLSYNLVYYSKVGGLPSTELSNLEMQMLHILDFRLDIPAASFVEIEANLVSGLTVMAANAPEPAVTELVSQARNALKDPELHAIPVELLPGEQSLHATTTCTPSLPIPLVTSPVVSATSVETPLSRNSSLASVPDEALVQPPPSKRLSFSRSLNFVRQRHSKTHSRFSHSPISPDSAYRRRSRASLGVK